MLDFLLRVSSGLKHRIVQKKALHENPTVVSQLRVMPDTHQEFAGEWLHEKEVYN